jgi:CHAD domain-containing protein
MPLHIKRSESLARAVQRICNSHIDDVWARLHKASHPASIHGARKEIKKLRAILQLIRGEIDHDGVDRIGKPLQKAASRLGIPRDARVTLKAFETLAGSEMVECFPKIHKKLQRTYKLETRKFRDEDSVSEAIQALKKLRRRVKCIKLKPEGWKAFKPGLTKSYRQGRKAWKLAQRRQTADGLHEWRKHVKTLCYQLRMLCPKWPSAALIMTEELEKLGSQLGEDHDYYLLSQFIKEHCIGRDVEAMRLNQIIKLRQKQLRSSAMKLGSRVYVKTPTAVFAHLETHWRTWRGEQND